jgi:hypothetical protein
MARGNARQKIVRDDADRRRLIDRLEQAVIRHARERRRFARWRLPWGSREPTVCRICRVGAKGG